MMSIKEHPPQLEASNDAPVHVPVLLDCVLGQTKPQQGESYLDLTAGYGGHARAILEKTANYSESTLVDRDEMAISSLADLAHRGIKILQVDFVTAAKQLTDEARKFDIILADLGVSSPQLDRVERGFSFQADGPLDMRMDQRQERSATTIVNSYSKNDLKRIIVEYGEGSPVQADRIASAIVSARPLSTTRQLAEIVESVSRHRGKHHPATRTFQALRIEVNQELSLIADLLPLLPGLLHPGGRLAIISFHSLEDRLVKRFFRDQAEAGYEAELFVLTKKPIDGKTYDVPNPRSRSAKLRAAVKK